LCVCLFAILMRFPNGTMPECARAIFCYYIWCLIDHAAAHTGSLWSCKTCQLLISHVLGSRLKPVGAWDLASRLWIAASMLRWASIYIYISVVCFIPMLTPVAIVTYIVECSLPAESELSTTNICIHPFSIQIQPYIPSNRIDSLQQRQVRSHAVDDRHIRCLLASWLSYHHIPFFLRCPTLPRTA
jgi:hypothetical protein